MSLHLPTFYQVRHCQQAHATRRALLTWDRWPQDPRPHVSVAWAAGSCLDSTQAAAAQLPRDASLAWSTTVSNIPLCWVVLSTHG